MDINKELNKVKGLYVKSYTSIIIETESSDFIFDYRIPDTLKPRKFKETKEEENQEVNKEENQEVNKEENQEVNKEENQEINKEENQEDKRTYWDDNNEVESDGEHFFSNTSLEIKPDSMKESNQVVHTIQLKTTENQKSNVYKDIQIEFLYQKKQNNINNCIELFMEGFIESLVIETTKSLEPTIVEIAQKHSFSPSFRAVPTVPFFKPFYNSLKKQKFYYLDLTKSKPDDKYYIEKSFSITEEELINLLKNFYYINSSTTIEMISKFLASYTDPNSHNIFLDNTVSRRRKKMIIEALKTLFTNCLNNLNHNSSHDNANNNVHDICIIILSCLVICKTGIKTTIFGNVSELCKQLCRIDREKITLPLRQVFNDLPNITSNQNEFLLFFTNIKEQECFLINTHKEDANTILNIGWIEGSKVSETLSFAQRKEKFLIFGPNTMNILHEYKFQMRKFHCIVESSFAQNSDISRKFYQDFKQYPNFLEYANVLFHPDNQFFDFNHVWNNGIILRNNVMMKLVNNSHEPKGYVIMRYYPIIYNFLKQYCSQQQMPTKAYALKGTPGTGKTIMFIYIILRWFQARDLVNDKNQPISTIFIKPPSSTNSGCLYFQYNESGIRFGIINKSYSQIKFRNRLKPYLGVLYSPANGYSISPKELVYENAQSLFLFDELKHSPINFTQRYMILNSIGSKYQNDKFIEKQIYTFLPNQDEMLMISSLIDAKYRNEYWKKYQLVQSNIRACVQTITSEELYNSAKTASENLHQNSYMSALQYPEKFLHKEINDARKYLIHINAFTPKDSQLFSYTHFDPNNIFEDKFTNYTVKTPSDTILSLLRHGFIVQKYHNRKYFFSIIPDTPKFQSIRGTWLEIEMNDVLKESNNTFSFYTRRIASRNDSGITNNYSHENIVKFTLNPESKLVYKTHYLDDLFYSKREVVYFISSPSNYPGFDSAYRGIVKRKTRLILIQYTVSDRRSFHIGIYEYILEKLKYLHNDWKLEFWAVIPNINAPFHFNNIEGFSPIPTTKEEKENAKELIRNGRFYLSLTVGNSNLAKEEFCEYTQNYVFRKAEPIFPTVPIQQSLT
ncbi:hypothetical protein TRFO_07798 [Tritrichomonas foetus]|uniref:Uncharacterized protein n=1 Tax=Tritrichomonas foetus TaxID=1144522 RepID=A0A1J4JNV2_9EUKA|nr:hypothetical protein TRFO_07798 [Tritrichomonas foetus]|eukprot:OHT00809.1 hypothetical protein TRFO_07798 [Tritrichomonas foetus]